MAAKEKLYAVHAQVCGAESQHVLRAVDGRICQGIILPLFAALKVSHNQNAFRGYEGPVRECMR